MDIIFQTLLIIGLKLLTKKFQTFVINFIKFEKEMNKGNLTLNVIHGKELDIVYIKRYYR